MINSPLTNYPSVEHVANVERMLNLLSISDESSQSHSTNKKIEHVESVEGDDLVTYFSTLSTLLKNSIVENQTYFNPLKTSDLDYFQRIPRFPLNQKASPSVELIFSWLQIAVDEGHIEPSQPCTGQILGWPVLNLL